MIHHLTQWLAGTAASEAIQRIFWIVPLVQTVHLLAIGILITSGLLVGFRLLGWAWCDQPIAAVAQRFLPWIWGALGVLFASGTVLIVGEPGRTLGNPAFWAKLVAIALAVALMLLLQRRPAAFAQSGRGARWLGAASVLLWVSALSLGRWIAYVLEA